MKPRITSNTRPRPNRPPINYFPLTNISLRENSSKHKATSRNQHTLYLTRLTLNTRSLDFFSTNIPWSASKARIEASISKKCRPTLGAEARPYTLDSHTDNRPRNELLSMRLVKCIPIVVWLKPRRKDLAQFKKILIAIAEIHFLAAPQPSPNVYTFSTLRSTA
ncbi:hypothetical protein BB561_001483 [Smittium simulii]|uniref:Uncharacterized protein n=1 Tax=Smittium simulii TaxID=133385 RepID=A0A2T9YUC2_9FUNG|nr:hypothetical protein BB561_001483 [Smittium simulii]